MEIVNSVYKTRLSCKLNLQKIAVKATENFTSTKLHLGRPTQLKIQVGDITCLIFSKGAIRLMGKGVINNLCLAYLTLYDILEKVVETNERPVLELQTMTAVANIGSPINLPKFEKTHSQSLRTFANFELFSAVQILKYRPVSVNLFSSGKLVLCGCKSEQQAQGIIDDILFYIQIMQELEDMM
jgi:TATA-box binding protein (TBP) (component of TFIID and TFIIIB)